MRKALSLILALVLLIGLLPMTVRASENEANPWEGRSAVFVGDSITYGVGITKKYYEYLDETLEFGSVTPMGVSGSCISAASDYGQSNQPLINRYQDIPSADLIVIFMGTNDYGHETPLGSVEDTQDGSFYGALNVIISALVAKHPSSKLVFVTPLHRYGFGTSKILGTQFTSDDVANGVGATLGDYVYALKTVCANNGVSVIDLYTECTLDPADAETCTTYMPDGLHPNAAGHEVIAGIMESHIRGFEPAEQEPVELTELVYGNRFAAGNNQTCRASSRVNYYLKAGTVITLKDSAAMQWACTKTSDETSSSNLGYFPDSGWSDKETAVVEADGWVGFVFKYRDETQTFDLTKPLSDYITIEEPHAHSYENGICTGCSVAQWDTDGDGVLEILAIGNSFSVDALEYAYQIAQDLGIEEVVIGNLYIGGCSLNTHATNVAGDLAKYTYYYNDNGTWTSTKSYKISTALESRSWDYISMQQASNYSGVESTYNEDLTNLIAYVQARSDAKLVWHMTWAYQQNSTHSAFPTYNKDQMTMYNAIVSAVQNRIVTNSNFDLIVPNGTAVQNSRTSLLGDTTTRDGYHMSKDYGRYLTGLLFIKTVTGLSVDNVTYAPAGVDAEEMAIAIESVNNAAAKPFEVTQSAYVEEEPEIPDEGYILLQSELYKGAFWYPINADHYNELVYDMSNSHQYFATIRFTLETLPVGSIIVLADGWQYRPDGWITDAVQTGTREPVTTESYVVITEEWWGDYIIRAFNISKVGLPSLANVTEEEVRAAFQIYVPEASHIHTYDNGLCTLCGAAQPGPIITKQPESVNAAIGEKFAVTVEAEGVGLTYQWYYKNSGGKAFATSSFKGKSYAMTMASYCHNRQIYCVITDANGNSVQSETVTITAPLTITKQPTDVQVEIGQKFSITVQALGDGLTYQWYYKNNGSKTFSVSSFKGKTYSMTMASYCHLREVYCVITDAYGNTVTTETVTISRPPVALRIVTQPQDVQVEIGQTATITVEAVGEGLSYQWYYKNRNGKDFALSNYKGKSYSMRMAEFCHMRQVYCVITDQYGNSVTTEIATMSRPSVELKILSQPQDISAQIGEKFSITVEVQGEGLTYQWYYKNHYGTQFARSCFTGKSYAMDMASYCDGREVYCVITDRYGNQVVTEVVTIRLMP